MANLSGADCSGAKLSGANLPDANLSGAEFFMANLSGANLFDANVCAANLSFADLSDANVSEVNYKRKDMRGKYQGIRVATCYGDALFRRDAQDQDYIDTVEKKWCGNVLAMQEELPGPHENPSWDSVRLFWRLQWAKLHPQFIWFQVWELTDFGRSFGRVGVFAAIMIALFAFTYGNIPDMLSIDTSETDVNWYTYLYYSIVTYTTLGFGDVTPKSTAAQVLVTGEVILGYVTLGLLVSILANKVARRA